MYICFVLRSNVLWSGTTRGVTVNTSVFIACHQCCCAGLSLAWGSNLRADVHVTFSEARRHGFSPCTPASSPPSPV